MLLLQPRYRPRQGRLRCRGQSAKCRKTATCCMGECCAEPPHSPFARGSSSNLPLHCGHRGHDVHRDGMVNLDRAHCVIQYVPSEHTASPCPPPLPRTSSHPPSARATLAPPQHASTRTWTCTHAHTRAHTRTHTLSTPRCSSRVCVHTHTHTGRPECNGRVIFSGPVRVIFHRARRKT